MTRKFTDSEATPRPSRHEKTPSSIVKKNIQRRTLLRGAAAALPLTLFALNNPTQISKASNLTEASETPAAALSSDPPSIISRSEWGADGNLYKWTPEYSRSIDAVVVHHTATENYYTTPEEAKVEIQNIYRYHCEDLDWGDIGYHFVVDRFGNIYEGRAGAIDTSVRGSHAYHFNRETIGIVMLGDFDQMEPTQQMIDSVGQLAGWKLQQFGTTDVLGTWEYRDKVLPRIHGHRDNYETECPGQYGEASLEAIRKIAVDYQKTHQTDQNLPPRTYGAINLKYYRSGGRQSILGVPISDEVSGQKNNGSYQAFQNGLVVWSPETGAHIVTDAIQSYWASNRYENGPLGYPLEDERSTDTGKEQHFQGGHVSWNKNTRTISVDFGDSVTSQILAD